MNIIDLPNEIIFEIALYLSTRRLLRFYKSSLHIRRAIEHPNTGLLEETFIIPAKIPRALQHKIQYAELDMEFIPVLDFRYVGERILAYVAPCHITRATRLHAFKKIISVLTLQDMFNIYRQNVNEYGISKLLNRYLRKLIQLRCEKLLTKKYKKCNFINVRDLKQWEWNHYIDPTLLFIKLLCPNVKHISMEYEE